ncbi:MAG: putative leader peptide [Mycobacteriales bacterium]
MTGLARRRLLRKVDVVYFTTELIKRRAVDLCRVGSCLCLPSR